MAKKLKHEDLVLNIIINGNKAQSELGKLARELQDAKQKHADLLNEQKRLEQQGKKNTQQYQQISQDIEQQSAAVNTLRDRITQLRGTMKLEDMTMKDLTATLRKLKQLRDQSIPGSDQFKKYQSEINTVQARMRELRSETEVTSARMGSMATNVSRYFTALLGGGFAISQLTSWVRKSTEVYEIYDDKIADVMKTTNAAYDQARDLSAELDKIVTRTSDNDLLGLARIGGKLGISDMDDLRGFVESSNQLVVALNEDLGGDVESTINAVGKLAEIFKLKDLYGMDAALLKVGSTINELGMASSANEAYLVEFSRRLAGVAPLAGVSLQETLALAATLDQLGQTAEVSSTSLSKLFLKMSSDADKFAKYAGMSVDDFKKGLETEFMPTFIKMLQGVRNNSQGLNELAATLGDLGVDAQRTTGVIGSLANNTGILQAQIDLANKSFDEGTSLTNEYNVKNSNTAAQLEISRKAVTRMWRELGEKLWPVIVQGNNLLTIFLGVISKTFTFIADNYKIIATLATTITVLTLAISAQTIATYAVAKAKAIATAAQTAWNFAMRANPIGIVISLLAGLITYISLYTRKTDEAVEAQKSLNKAKNQAIKDTAAETAAIERNLKVATDRNRTDNQRLAAVNKLREIMPDVLKDYSNEAIMAGQATKAIKDQVKELVKLATIKAYNSKLDDLASKKVDLEDQRRRGFAGATFSERLGTIGNFFSSNYQQAYANTIDARIKAVKTEEERFAEEITKLQGDVMKAITTTTESDDPNGATPITPSGDGKADKKAEAARKKAFAKALDEAEKYYQAQLQQEGLFRKDKRLMTTEEHEKLLKIEEAYQSKLDEIYRQHNEPLKNSTREADKELTSRMISEQKYIDSLIKARKKEVDIERIAHQERLTQAGLFGIERKDMTDKQLMGLEILEKQHADNLSKIDNDAYNTEYQRLQKAYDIRLADMKIAHNEELASFTTLEQAKNFLRDKLSARELAQIKTLQQARRIIQNQHQLEEQQATREHLESLLKILQEVMASGQWDGLSLSDAILSDEEKANLESKIREVKEALAKLKAVDLSDDLASRSRQKVDVLGMSTDDWETLFANISRGKMDVEGMLGVLDAGVQIWGQYNKMVVNKENAQIQKDEEANRKKKDNLQKRLDAGAISQDEYNKQVERMDKDLDRKKAIVARNQAKRERNIALMTSIVNTAKAVTAVLPNFILAAIVGAFGALQIGTIMSTPLPEIPGLATGGGFMDVTRSQDGKKYRAKADPARRGYVSNPTVLVGEDGTEWVASAAAVANPAIKPILDVLDIAQKQGRISAITASDLLASMPGRASGGYVQSSPNTPAVDSSMFDAYSQVLQENTKVMIKLSKQLDKPIPAQVSLLGPNGFIEKNNEYQQIIKNSSL